MNQTPPEFKKLADSAELYDQSEAIGAKFGLHIDQTGELDAEIRDILNGVSNSVDFSKHIMERLEIDRKLADEIVVEVNKVVFQAVRDRVQSSLESAQTELENASAISNIEQLGGFSIEKDAQPAQTAKAVTPADREQILSHLENPPQSGPLIQSTPSHTEPLIDHLLQNPVGFTEQKQHAAPHVPDNLPVAEELAKPAAAPVATAAPKPVEVPKPQQRPGPDPYRELIK